MSVISVHKVRRVVLSSLLFMVFVGLFVYPIVRLLLMPWIPALGPTEAMGVHSSNIGLSPVAIANTMRLGLASTLVAVPLGLGFGWLLERRHWRGKGLFMLTLWLIFLTPSYLLTSGWQIVFSIPMLHHGHLAKMFFGQIGIIMLLGLKGFPFACLAARGSWRAIGSEIVDAARIHVAGAWQRRSVLLRLLLPAVGSAFAIVFIESIQEFGIPATLGAQIHLPIITYAIYERLAMTPVDFTHAALLSWTLVVLAAGAASVHFYLGRRFGSALVHGRQRQSEPQGCSCMESSVAAIAALALFIFGIAIPGGAIIYAALWHIDPYKAVLVPWSTLLYSTLYASIAALLAVSVAMLLISGQRRARDGMAHMVDAMTLGNMAIPGLVLGAAYIIAFNVSWLPLYGTPSLLIIAYVAAQIPVLVRFMQAPMRQVHASMSDAARLHGMPWLNRVADVQAPLLMSPFLWGWAMAFGHVFFELPISELLYPAGRAPIGVAIITLNQKFHYTEEARLALAGIALSLVIVGLVAALLRLSMVPSMAKEQAA